MLIKRLREFGLDIKGIMAQEELTDEQVAFLEYFDWKLPVGDHGLCAE